MCFMFHQPACTYLISVNNTQRLKRFKKKSICMILYVFTSLSVKSTGAFVSMSNWTIYYQFTWFFVVSMTFICCDHSVYLIYCNLNYNVLHQNICHLFWMWYWIMAVPSHPQRTNRCIFQKKSDFILNLSSIRTILSFYIVFRAFEVFTMIIALSIWWLKHQTTSYIVVM